ncbi:MULTISPECIES: hypothetical protein [Pseudomonas]|uniref:hypothetical protein n=1 Tax=Pseudomonas TaxID=286 RepID=UPI00070CF5E2|nr:MULTISPECIES: hypothetical protein [Pseudomonas]KQW33963.1 hypothetical protein ASC85_04705 [Pseudomonas sp. Root401]WHS53565.1 hypothetical protein QLH64_25100 [Pseudomonas brassicacearum]
MTQSSDTTDAGTLDPSFANGGVLRLPTPEFTGYYIQAILPLAGKELLLGMRLAGEFEPIGLAKLNEGGSIDMAFGGAGTGLVEFYLKGARLYVSQLRALSDGGWLVLGDYQTNDGRSGGKYLLRYFQDGQLDRSFGENGLRLLPVREEQREVEKKPRVPGWDDEQSSVQGRRAQGRQGAAAVQQSDGKIVWINDRYPESGPLQQIVLRLNSDGSMDDTFNGVGFAVIELKDIPYDSFYADAVAVQADGKVLVAGYYSKTSPASRGVYVTRFDATGRLDTSFNGGVVTVANSELIHANAITVRERDGAIVVIGRVSRDRHSYGLMFVLTSSGFFDFHFNRGQPLFSALLAQGQDWRRCALQADGSILASGTTGRGVVEEVTTALTARFHSDGSLDPTFNGSGFVVFDEDEQYETVEDMAVMTDGRIVVAGFTWVDGEEWPYVPYIDRGWIIRYLA